MEFASVERIGWVLLVCRSSGWRLSFARCFVRPMAGVFVLLIVLILGCQKRLAPDSSTDSTSFRNTSPQSGSAGATAQTPPRTTYTYTTSFRLTENPISEGGKWLNGRTNGLDWNDFRTTPGSAMGYVPNGVYFADPIAVLDPATTGPWSIAQQAQGTVFIHAGAGDYYPEVELHTNVTIAPHKITGYEFDCGVLNEPNAGCAIVRWNGPLANGPPNWNSNHGYTPITPAVPVIFQNGDVMRAVNTGAATNNLQLYRNGVLVVEGTDHTWTGGSPGIGVNGSDPTQINNYADEGFTNFSASNIASPPPSSSINRPGPSTNAVSRENSRCRRAGCYFSCFSSTTITSIGLMPAFTSACIVLGGFAGSQ